MWGALQGKIAIGGVWGKCGDEGAEGTKGTKGTEGRRGGWEVFGLGAGCGGV